MVIIYFCPPFYFSRTVVIVVVVILSFGIIIVRNKNTYNNIATILLTRVCIISTRGAGSSSREMCDNGAKL